MERVSGGKAEVDEVVSDMLLPSLLLRGDSLWMLLFDVIEYW